MSTTLTVTIDESKGRLRFSRALMLGSEYDIEWVGEGAASPRLVLSNPLTDEILAQSDSDDVLKLNTVALINLFADSAKRPKSLYAYAYADSVVLGSGIPILAYSPLSFESGPDPELVTGLSDRITAHTSNLTNPHQVTLAQIGAAAASHGHEIENLTITMPDGRSFHMKFAYVSGQLTHYYEEIT